jgi:DNA repair protein RadC
VLLSFTRLLNAILLHLRIGSYLRSEGGLHPGFTAILLGNTGRNRESVGVSPQAPRGEAARRFRLAEINWSSLIWLFICRPGSIVGEITVNPAAPQRTSPPYPDNRIRVLPAAERPQERLERLGVSALSDTELLAMIVRSGTQGQDVLTLSSRLISEAGSLAGLLAWHEADFRKLRGIGRVKALQLVAAMEIARRAISLPPHESPILNRADLIAAHLESITSGLEVEKFWVLCLDRRNRLRKRVEVSSGTATAALAHPREVFRSAIREAAAAVICAHNHPSGDPSPSAADIQLTRQLREAAAAVDIPLLDHVIIGRRGADPLGRGYYSFREAGLL